MYASKRRKSGCTLQNTKHGTRNTKHGTRNTKHETRNTKHETRNTKHDQRVKPQKKSGCTLPNTKHKITFGHPKFNKTANTKRKSSNSSNFQIFKLFNFHLVRRNKNTTFAPDLKTTIRCE